MKWRNVIITLVILLVAATCVRLGFWQLSRLHEKQRLNAAMRAAMAAPPLAIDGDPPAADRVLNRRVSVWGHYDESRQILLAYRAREGSPGVDVVTPLIVKDSKIALLVDRGWLYSPDGATARPQNYPEPGMHEVMGLAQPIRRVPPPTPMRVLLPEDRERITLWSTRFLDPDSLPSHFPYALAPYVLRELPGPDVPAQPVRAAPQPLDELMHLSYAVQWFLFAAILLGGSAVLAWSRRRSGRLGAPSDAGPAPSVPA